jgi:iron complex outermembrane receptor protein
MSSVTCDGVSPCVPLREPRKIWGIEANTDWQIDEQWKVGGILTWQEGTRKISGGDIRRITANDVTPLLVSGYLDYAPYSWWRNTLQIDFRNSKDSFGASTTFGEGRIDSVTLVHLAAAFDVGPGELHFGIRNLFNEKYFSIKSEAGNTASLWVPEEGTRILTSYVVKW